ncbi:MAG: ATP-binding protein [Bryobacterales bacterium]|jgi:serine/threonine-protein kinase RsbW|nr:ATP-binding protein [Bryobacterales bacterium]
MGANWGGESVTTQHVFPSTLESVDQAEQTVLDAARQAGFPEDDLHGIAMAVRECVINAVTHGNRYDSEKTVRVSVTRTAEDLTVRIADQGEGFDPEALPDPLAEENLLRSSGRGVFLVRAFMDEYTVRRIEPSGTEVTIVKRRDMQA